MSILGWPNELKIKIFGNLSVIGLQALRLVCSHFRNLIDQHIRQLSQTIKDREAARLQQFVDYNIRYVDKPGWEQCLARWVHHRDIWTEEFSRGQSIGCWATNYVLSLREDPRLHAQLLEDWINIAMNVLDVHVQRYQPDLVSEPLTKAGFVADCARRRHAAIDPDEARKLYEKIVSGDSGLQGVMIHGPDEEWTENLSPTRGFVTPLNQEFENYWSSGMALDLEEGDIDIDHVLNLLPLPVLPSNIFAYVIPRTVLIERLFAYDEYLAVRSGWSLDRQYLLEAACMEELDIF